MAKPYALCAVVAAVGAMLLGCTASAGAPEPSPTPFSSPSVDTASPTPASPSAVADAPPLSREALERVDEQRIFFAHRSVGEDIVKMGLPQVFSRYGVAPLRVVDGLPDGAGSLGDHWLNQTDDPATKLDDFETWIRDEGVPAHADIAVMKLGYVDVTAETDVPALFDAYRSMMQDLESAYPELVFLHVTVSVTDWVPENNAAIERYNQLMRAEYGTGERLFDLAATISTCSDGEANLDVTEAGETYRRICPEYSRDGGHLNERGADVAATEFLRRLAAISD